MATQAPSKLEELRSVLAECKDKNVDELIGQAEHRVKLLREVKKMLGIESEPKPRIRKKEEAPVAGTVGSKAS